MERGASEKREMIDGLETLRAAVREADLPPGQRADLEYTISELERDILVPIATDTGPVLEQLAAWGPVLAPGFPELAGVLVEQVRRLRDMGIRGATPPP